ncbi:MAG: excinuclease ABC subunit UvrB [Phycisphaeraceae bacterium]
MPRDQFELVSEFQPMGDQPAAIDALTEGIVRGDKHQTLLGATGTGKTFSIANVIARVNKPTLVISHNKTLAAQLYEEFRDLFPDNAVSYFVSYYDYYQPEAYIPARDIYIEKDASRNDDLDRLRLAATSALMSRRDVIVVASVSCIFGLGSPDEYRKRIISLSKGQLLARRDLFLALNDLQYKRAEVEFKRGTYRVRGEVIEIHPADEEYAWRVECFGDEIERLEYINPLTGEILGEEKVIFIHPAVHYIMDPTHLEQAIENIKAELDARVMQMRHEGKLLEAQRLMARTKYDLEMMQEIGYCSGIENYSRHLDGRPAGSKPHTLWSYFDACVGEGEGEGMRAKGQGEESDPLALGPSSLGPSSSDWLLVIDESHVTLPQMRAMYHGDQARKKTLVEHGFRLPSALDNRPMRFEEIEKLWPQVIFVSATPGPYELAKTGGVIVEQIIRPTGLVDPVIDIQPAATQVPHLIEQCKRRTAAGERTLVITLTKRLAEDLSTYLKEAGLKCEYLHSDVETLDRVEILRHLREGKFDVLVGINLLREGLDLPEVSLVAILDADKTGFLRSPTSLIQQIGRAARNVNAKVILYADTVTPAMKQAIDETNRRRDKQLAYNAEHGITPRTIQKEIRRGIEYELRARETVLKAVGMQDEQFDVNEYLVQMEKEMLEAAEKLEFERAARLRDLISEIKANPDSFTGASERKKKEKRGKGKYRKGSGVR